MDVNSLFALADKWGATPLEKHPNAPKIHTRTIGDFTIQVVRQDYKARTDMAMSLLRQVEGFFGVAGSAVAVTASEGEAQAAAAAAFLPAMIGALARPEFAAMLDKLVAHASLANGDKFEPLSQPHVAERMFGDDLTLQIPVALSVLEVNLGDGFFNRLQGVFT